MQLIAGGNLIKYPGSTSTLTTGIVTIKIHWNSIILTSNNKYYSIDIKDFYLNSLLGVFEYMRILFNILLQYIIIQYNLLSIVAKDSFTYMEVNSSICGLLQVEQLAHDNLVAYLAPYNYVLVKYTPGLWVYKSNSISFTLIVDNFCIKYSSETQLQYLIDALKAKYTITIDMSESLHIGVSLK